MPDTDTIVAPTVTSDSTSRADLHRQLCAAMNAIEDALVHLDRARPNPHDYDAPAAFALAQAQHQARRAALIGVVDELEYIACNL